MIHGDLKGVWLWLLPSTLLSQVLFTKLNILIDQDRHARLADFGLLTIVSDHTNFTASSSAFTGGTMRWMSPELFHPEQFGSDNGRPTKESDCYALGMVIYEVLTGQPPFTPLKDYIVMRKVTDGERPGRPEGAKGTLFEDDLWKMLGLCWAMHAQSRPSIEAVRECLERVSSTWKPLPPQTNEGMEKDENDWDLSILTV
jgi:serine/threonine protein kinase